MRRRLISARFFRCCVLSLIIIAGIASPTLAATEKRVALVIGNGAYSSTPLDNPPNDARAMTAILQEAGFEVQSYGDLDQSKMKRAIQHFGETLGEAGPLAVGLFYFAGHGVQVNGHNYLIPVGADIRREPDVEIEAVDAGGVLSMMEYSHNRLNIIILDACRNNPFKGSSRSAGGGLARMDAPIGSLIAYATAPGSVAADGDGKNGIYTEELIRAMHQPGMKIEDVFKTARVSVLQRTGNQQVPWESSSLTGDFYMFGGGTTTSPTADTAPMAPQQTLASASTPRLISQEKATEARGKTSSRHIAESPSSFQTDHEGKPLSLQEYQGDPRVLLVLGSSKLEDEVRLIKPLLSPVGNFMRGQASIQNMTDATFLLSYKIDWFDSSGFLIGNGGVWYPVVLRPRQIMPIKSVGKDTDAARMQVTIRLTN